MTARHYFFVALYVLLWSVWIRGLFQIGKLQPDNAGIQAMSEAVGLPLIICFGYVLWAVRNDRG
jgi:hypothetical protein